MDKFEQDLPLLPVNADELSHTVKKRVVEVLGGKEMCIRDSIRSVPH